MVGVKDECFVFGVATTVVLFRVGGCWSCGGALLGAVDGLEVLRSVMVGCMLCCVKEAPSDELLATRLSSPSHPANKVDYPGLGLATDPLSDQNTVHS